MQERQEPTPTQNLLFVCLFVFRERGREGEREREREREQTISYSMSSTSCYFLILLHEHFCHDKIIITDERADVLCTFIVSRLILLNMAWFGVMLTFLVLAIAGRRIDSRARIKVWQWLPKCLTFTDEGFLSGFHKQSKQISFSVIAEKMCVYRGGQYMLLLVCFHTRPRSVLCVEYTEQVKFLFIYLFIYFYLCFTAEDSFAQILMLREQKTSSSFSAIFKRLPFSLFLFLCHFTSCTFSSAVSCWWEKQSENARLCSCHRFM